ncbi:MAG: hypothetical protein PHN26_03530 [Eubacteriaceae bacterium]|nr:hypothetical protein [Eubacteriaceae bacterium]
MDHQEVHDLALVTTKMFLELYEHDFEDSDFEHIVQVANQRYHEAVTELTALNNDKSIETNNE